MSVSVAPNSPVPVIAAGTVAVGAGLRAPVMAPLTDVPVTYPALAPNALTVISLPTSAVPTVYDVPVAPPIADVPRYHW